MLKSTMVHTTWKYGWKAGTYYGLEFVGSVMFPTENYSPTNKETGERISDPKEIARYHAKLDAEDELRVYKEKGRTKTDDFIKSLNVWEMADNNLR